MAALLRQGSRGQDVANVQDALNTAGKSKQPALTVDGIFGAKTRARVTEFQVAHALGADGIVGPLTRSRLQPHMRPGGATVNVTPGGGGGRPPGGGGGTPTIGSGDVVAQVIASANNALGMWRSTARFTFVRVEAIMAISGQGCVSGPHVSGFILGSLPLDSLSPDDLKLAEAAASGIGSCMAEFQRSIHVPGLPWYPSFVAFPGPFAPPTPNVPSALAGMSNPGAVSVGAMQSAITGKLGGGGGAQAGKAAAIAAAVGSQYSAFAVSASVRMVMGTGPVPSFAPPAVPVGPVVNGTVISGGGHF